MSKPEEKKKFKLSLSQIILLSLVLGIITGLFFGEYCSNLEIIGSVYIKLLQMTVLPYLMISLIYAIGRLTYLEARILATKLFRLILIVWTIGVIIILVMPLAFPDWESASFFSTTLLETPKPVNFLDLYIPSNPFRSMAGNFVPAVVLFSIAIGIALIGIQEKDHLLILLDGFSKAISRVAGFMVKITPIGVFALSAAAAGTMNPEELGRLGVYFATYHLSVVLLTFWILPMLVTTLTTIKFKDVWTFSKDSLCVAFATGSLFITLPILAKGAKDLLNHYQLVKKEEESTVDAVLPVVYAFPNYGRFLALLFLLFAAWYSGNEISLADYPSFAITGVLSLFVNSPIAVPFLLDSFHIPADYFQLFVLTGVINGRFSILLAAGYLFTMIVLASTGKDNPLRIRWPQVARFAVLSSLILLAGLVSTKALLNATMEGAYDKDKVLGGMHLLKDPAPFVVRQNPPGEFTVLSKPENRLKEIRKRGTLRVGFNAEQLPFSFFNTKGELVGFDIELAHNLAKDMGVKLEFIPFKMANLSKHVQAGHFDLVMSAIAITPPRLEKMDFSNPYLDVTLALVVQDHRRDEFSTREKIKSMKDLKIGMGGEPYFMANLQRALPQAEIVTIQSKKEFFEEGQLDALLTSAESGSAWTLLYPRFQAVVPRPRIISVPLGYPIAGNDMRMVQYINGWIDLQKKNGTIDRLYNYWILGKGTSEKAPRWSVIRNVLGWVK